MIRSLAVVLFFLGIHLVPSVSVAQADYKRYFDEDNLPKVRELFQSGQFDFVIQICDYALRRGQPSWEWRTLRFESLASVGRYEEALDEAAATTEKFSGELGALLRAHELFSEMGRKEDAARILDNINAAAAAVPERERTPRDLVYLGEAALVLGADPATVMEQYFGLAKKTEVKGRDVSPGVVEAFLAAGELALEKDDFQRAAEEFRGALELEPENPEILFGLARSFFPDDRKQGMEFLEKILERAPLHDGALLLRAEFAINFEKYDEAARILDQVQSVNPRHPKAFAYRAVLAELESNDAETFRTAREEALDVWKDNPEVDYLIGRVLSRKYRYQEGAGSQKRALEMDPDFLPAKLQLALDYLRLGRIDEAWPLAEEVGAADEYNVLAYNLEVLKGEIESFASVETDDFIVRLPPEEAEIYGDRVVEILTEAKAVLGEKYGLEIEDRTLVEFYPNQQDFAIRSFGSLGGEGLLGVCFGSVVTMNSPGSVTAGKSNWEATLWHEYCHVVTLTATRNKMPRWLSEGISVYEEIQRQDNWGQTMTPDYRRRILEDEGLTPIADMSQAFFQAKSGEDVMFAYYQSMLVVEYIVENFGIEALRNILSDLGDGVLVNDALGRHTLPMPELEAAFAAAAFELAENYGAGVDWERPEPDTVNPLSSLAVAAFLKKNPDNFWARQLHARQMLDEEKWDEAVRSAEALIELLPEYTGENNGYTLKAVAYREKGDSEGEEEALGELSELSAEAFAAYTRLLDVNFEERNWTGVLKNADRSLAINPFFERIHYCSGCAHEARDEGEAAVASFEKALLLAPANPSELKFRLARLLRDSDGTKAKRYLLDALADSPRFREAHAFLLDFEEKDPAELPR
ncbi:MAG: tetratricopeptide repeat protein [Verrucomicrobiales bacterium]